MNLRAAWALVLVLLAGPSVSASPEEPGPSVADPAGDVQVALQGLPPEDVYPPEDGMDLILLAVGPDDPQYLPLWFQVVDKEALESWDPAAGSGGLSYDGSVRFEWDFTPDYSDANIAARAIWSPDGWFYAAQASGPGYQYGVRVNGTADGPWIRIEVPRHLFDDPAAGDALRDFSVYAWGYANAALTGTCGTTVACDPVEPAGFTYIFTNSTSGGLVFSRPDESKAESNIASTTFTARNEGISWRFSFDDTTRTFTVSTEAPAGWEIEAPRQITVPHNETQEIEVHAILPEGTLPGRYDVRFSFRDERRVDTVVWQVGVPDKNGHVPAEPAAADEQDAPLSLVAAPLLVVVVALLRRWDH